MIARQQFFETLEGLARGIQRELELARAGKDLVEWWERSARARWDALTALVDQAYVENATRAEQWYVEWRTARWPEAVPSPNPWPIPVPPPPPQEGVAA